MLDAEKGEGTEEDSEGEAEGVTLGMNIGMFRLTDCQLLAESPKK